MEMEATEPTTTEPEAEGVSAEEMAAFARWVEELGIAHRAQAALRGLMDAGPRATLIVRQGLQHPNPEVRVGCCKVLDHFLDESALPELIENLAHPDEEVRSWALHALACDKCKEGVCRPGEADVIPLAVEMLLTDRSRRVRQMAAGRTGAPTRRTPSRAQDCRLVHSRRATL
jgi:HEAT repeat protein